MEDSPQDFLLADFENDLGYVLKLKQRLNVSGQDTTYILSTLLPTSSAYLEIVIPALLNVWFLVALIIPLGKARGSEGVIRIESVAHLMSSLRRGACSLVLWAQPAEYSLTPCR